MSATEWLTTTTRWGQVNFNERDPVDLDVGWWSAYWQECGLQGVTLSIGGPVAYYPTDVPGHTRSPFLGDRDLLGETVAEAKRLGMRVLGRLDPLFASPELYQAHPDWCLTRRDGRPLLAGAEPKPLYFGCPSSPYFSEFLGDVLTEVLTRYDIDGVFTNGWPVRLTSALTPKAMCHCPYCVAAWDAVHPGQPRPESADPQDPLWRAYVDLELSQAEAAQQRLRELTSTLLPAGTFLSAAYASPGAAVRWERWTDLVDALGIDGQSRRVFNGTSSRPPALWEAGQQSELLRAVSRGKPMIRFVATFMTGEPLFRHAARPALETRLIMASALAHGELPKWHTVGGVSYDRRWMPAVRELQRWMATNEQYLQDRSSIAEVGVVWSPRSLHLAAWSGDGRPSHEEALTGWYAALTEARIPCDYVHESDLDRLGDYRVVVLPSGLALDDQALEALHAYRWGGGVLVSCCDALSRDAWGAPRDGDRLAGLLAGVPDGTLLGPSQHSCIDLRDAQAVLGAFGDTDLIGAGRWVAPFRPAPGASIEGAWVPDYPVNPTHLVVLPEARTDLPLVAIDRSRLSVHLAADLDASYGRLLYPDHRQVLQQAVRHALGDSPRRVEVRGGGLLDVRVWEQPGCTTVWLVNLDNPMLHGPAVTESRPQGPLEVVLRGAKPTNDVRLLRHGTKGGWSTSGDELTVQVPIVDDFEVVAVDTGQAEPSVGLEPTTFALQERRSTS